MAEIQIGDVVQVTPSTRRQDYTGEVFLIAGIHERQDTGNKEFTDLKGNILPIHEKNLVRIGKAVWMPTPKFTKEWQKV